MDIFDFLLTFFINYSYWAVLFVLLICGMGVPIPEDITLVTGGVVAGLYPEQVNVHLIFLVSLFGVLAGDGMMFLLGRIYGERVLTFKPVAKLLTPQRFEAVQKKFDQYGNWVLFVARFMPGLRSPIFIVAGMSGISYWRFLLADGLAALISVPVWVYLGYYGASNIDWLLSIVHKGQMGIFIVLGLMAAVLGFLWWRNRRRIAEKLPQVSAKLLKSTKRVSRKKRKT